MGTPTEIRIGTIRIGTSTILRRAEWGEAPAKGGEWEFEWGHPRAGRMGTPTIFLRMLGVPASPVLSFFQYRDSAKLYVRQTAGRSQVSLIETLRAAQCLAMANGEANGDIHHFLDNVGCPRSSVLSRRQRKVTPSHSAVCQSLCVRSCRVRRESCNVNRFVYARLGVR